MWIIYHYIPFCWRIWTAISWRIISTLYTIVWIKVFFNFLLFQSLSNTLRLYDICCLFSIVDFVWIVSSLIENKLNVLFREQQLWGIIAQSLVVFMNICWVITDLFGTCCPDLYDNPSRFRTRFLWKCYVQSWGGSKHPLLHQITVKESYWY